MKFPYHKLSLYPPSPYFGSFILKPIIPVTLIVNDKTLRYTALIDSGADFSIFDAEIGEYLGIPVREGHREEFGGIQGQGDAVAFLHEVILNIGGNNYKTKIGFSYDIARHGFGILGQKGFFEIFVVKFDFVSEEIEIVERT